MLFAVLVCSDQACEDTYEAYGEPDELDWLSCESCACALQVVAFSEARPNGRLDRGVDLRLRDAA
jgi:hypothetical protein